MPKIKNKEINKKMNIKKNLKFAWDEFIYGGHLTSLGASSILASVAIIFNQKISISFIILGYLIFQIIYFYNHYKESKKDLLTNLERVKHIEKIKNYILIFFGLYWLLFFLCLIYINNLDVALLSLFIVIGGLLYTIFFKNFTKKIIGFKSFYVSFFWALLIIIGGTYYNISFSFSLFLLFSFIFFYGIFNTIFFDIKDLESDKKEKLKTIPVLLGKKRTLNLLYVLNFFSFAPLIIGVYKNYLPFFILCLIFFCFYRIYYLEKIRKRQINIQYLSYIMVDGECIFWPLLLIIGKILGNLKI